VAAQQALDLSRRRINAEVERVLDVQLPGWRDEPEVVRERQEAWQEMLGRLQRFVVGHQRLPRQKETAEVAAVGEWLHTQKALHRNQQLAPTVCMRWPRPCPAGAHRSAVHASSRASVTAAAVSHAPLRQSHETIRTPVRQQLPQ